MKNNLKKVTAGLLALSLVTGTVPVQPIAELFTNQTAITASADMAGEPSWTSNYYSFNEANFFKLGNRYYRPSSSNKYVQYNHNNTSSSSYKLESLDTSSAAYLSASDGWVYFNNTYKICAYNDSFGTVVGVVRAYGAGSTSDPLWFYPVYKDDCNNYFAVYDDKTIPFSIRAALI